MCSLSPHRPLRNISAVLSLAAVSLGLPQFSAAQSLKFTSSPPGATVELDGVPAGTTPFEKNFPGGYFHRTKTAIGQRLEHPMVARISLTGFATHEIALTEGPMDWIDLHGRHHGQYWLFKSDHFHADLQSLATTFTGSVSVANADKTVGQGPQLSLEELVRRTKPAVVFLKGLQVSGSGFFITETGLIATNAHLVREDSSLLARLPNGVQLQTIVVFTDPNLDLALMKAVAPSTDSVFPSLPLADSTFVHQGESVFVIGNPGDGMEFSVTQGVVSAVGHFSAAGPGTWIQTDAPINPGNSGGPLLNQQGEVIGLNTLKVIRKNVTGIGFALSAGDLLEVLARFYPGLSPLRAPGQKESVTTSAKSVTRKVELSAPMSQAHVDAMTPKDSVAPEKSLEEDFGSLLITSDMETAEIHLDGKFIGSAPASLRLLVGPHTVVIQSPGFPDFIRLIDISKSGNQTLKATFQTPALP